MDAKELIADRQEILKKSQALLDAATKDKRSLTDGETKEFEELHLRAQELKKNADAQVALDAEAKELDELRARAEEQEAEKKRLSESRGRKTLTTVVDQQARDSQLCLRAWALGERGMARANREVRADLMGAAERMGFDYRQGAIDAEFRVMSVGTTTAGGAGVPNEMMKAFVEEELFYGRVEALATVLNTDTGATLPIPLISDTANSGAITSEGGTAAITADPLVGVRNLGAFKYTSDGVVVSFELLQDMFLNLPQYLGRRLGERIFRKKNADFTTGVGTTQPNGVVPRCTNVKEAAATNAITMDEVIDLLHGLDIAYRSAPGAGFMAHDLVYSYIRKLKDSNGLYMWQPSVVAGEPDRLLGYPCYPNNAMQSTLTTNKSVLLLGDFKAYYVRNAGGVRFVRSDEKYVLEDQVLFLAYQRSDGDLVDTRRIVKLLTKTS